MASDITPATTRRQRVRLVSTAWGERYIGELFAYTLPALLAPGNLPALAAQFDCELVIVTEEGWFERLRQHPIYRRIEQHCPIELRPVDEFITRPDAYGVALTHALFRGFDELGPAMLEIHIVFFNADFIMADGSLRSVGQRIAAGERLILSPSYCVVLEAVAPRLAARRDDLGGVLAMPPREMAALALRHRHNSIRGKTINQRLFSMEWIDQFYWLVDETTLIGHQLPIAVVAMRPTQVLTEMRTFWDYGIISEACPGVVPCVLGDLDDFLMIELRKAETARDQTALGWPTPQAIAAKLETFITKDPRDLAMHTLVLHSGDLPTSFGEAKHALDAYVNSVLRELPPVPSEYINHPIWAYHYPYFQQARCQYLARKGGGGATPRTSVAPAPPKIPASPSAPAVPEQPLLAAGIGTRLRRLVFGTAPKLQPWHPHWPDMQPVLRRLAANPDARVLVVASDGLPERLFAMFEGEHVALREITGEPPVPRANVAERGTKVVRIVAGDGVPATIHSSDDAAPREVRLLSAEFALDALSELMTDAPATAVPDDDQFDEAEAPVTEEFDLCICEIGTADLPLLARLVRRLAPRIRSGGTIIVHHLAQLDAGAADTQALILNNAFTLDQPCSITFTSSPLSIRARLGFGIAVNNLRSHRPAKMARGTIQLVLALSCAWRASRQPPGGTLGPTTEMTNFAIEISIRHAAAAALGKLLLGDQLCAVS